MWKSIGSRECRQESRSTPSNPKISIQFQRIVAFGDAADGACTIFRQAARTNGQARNHERRLVTWVVYKRRGLATLPELRSCGLVVASDSASMFLFKSLPCSDNACAEDRLKPFQGRMTAPA
jgi:hypothetical protein